MERAPFLLKGFGGGCVCVRVGGGGGHLFTPERDRELAVKEKAFFSLVASLFTMRVGARATGRPLALINTAQMLTAKMLP